MPGLTKRLVDSVRRGGRDIVVWDGELRGFGLKVTPAGKRSCFCYYRTRDGRQRRPKIGDHGPVACEQAREVARGRPSRIDPSSPTSPSGTWRRTR